LRIAPGQSDALCVAGSSNSTILDHLNERVGSWGGVPDLRSDRRRAAHYCTEPRTFTILSDARNNLLINCNSNVTRRSKHSYLPREGERVHTARQVSKIHHAPLVTLRDTVQNSGPATRGGTHSRRSHPREEYHQNIVPGGKSKLFRNHFPSKNSSQFIPLALRS